MSVFEQQQDGIGVDLQSLADAAKWVADACGVLGLGISIIFRGVTNVKEWENRTDQEVEVWKLDGGSGRKDYVRIPPGQTRSRDHWVAWADNPEQFRDHRGIVQVAGVPTFYFWQSGDGLWFGARDEYLGIPIPGVEGAGGNRRMYIGTDPQGRHGLAVGPF